MRLTIFLLITGCLAVQASGYAQKVNLSVRNTGIESVCLDIKQQTGYFFLYDAEALKKSGNVSLELKNVELRDALKQMTAGKALDYKIIDKTVIISETKSNIKAAEDIVIRGTVRSKEGPGQSDIPLPGVIVTLKETKKSVATNGEGTYSIVAPVNGTLIFSMIGYGTKEISINGNSAIDVVMVETASDLKEVIVNGYGTSETKENQVGSASQVTRKDLDRKPLDRIDKILEGIVPGLQYDVQGGTASSARPRYQVRVRGEASIGASNEPLWVIDGIPVNTGNETNMILGVNTSVSPLTYLNPNDIESVTVLKDATATTIYGANGSNGVILITTKRGKAGADRVNYSYRTGINLIQDSRFHVLNGDQYRELYLESYRNNPNLDQSKTPTLSPTSTDWYDVFFRNGMTSQHDLSLSGGNEKSRYYISGAYFREKSIMINNLTQRFSTRVNLDQKINKSIDLFVRMGASYNLNNLFNPGSNYYKNRPIDSPYNPDGSLVIAYYNKLADAELNDENQKTMAMFGSIGGTVKILPELTFTTTNGINYSGVNENIYSSMLAFSNRGLGYATRAQSNFFEWDSQQRLNFSKKIGVHDFSVLVSTEARNQNRRSLSSSGSGFANDKIREVSYASVTTGTSSAEEKASLSYLGQFRYTIADKYALIGNFRGDGDSDFGSDVKWATFKSIGASWTISNENFWDFRSIDFAKLKLSYGTNGNSRIGTLKSKGVYSFGTNNSYNEQPGAIMTSGENPALTWETTYIVNGGISLGLFKRVSLELELYRKTTKDILDNVDVTRATGFTRVLQNIGKVRNTGVELTLNTKNIDSKDFQWRTSLNMAHNQNKILALYNGNDKVSGNMMKRVGADLNSWYLVRWAGVDPRDGNPMWYDANQNITKEFNLDNRVLLGSTTPDLFGGMTNTIQYKSFSLSALIIYNIGGYDFSDLQRDVESDGRNLATDNQSTNLLDRWREPGDLSLIPKTVLNENANNARNSTRFLHDKTNIRLQNVSVNYDFPKELVSRIKLQNASVYLQADNVGFWTPYKTYSNRNNFKNSFNPYPQPVVISIGLNVGL
ncbi:MAG: SusC/RagA family TonB-linked outer membrane protein [Candidatus Pedobacter colombiensis]|uniref:SusC/RagA family TonB-linked outer membrane protein n=1 Tax=Candidatus Pedobacter colombiensis TaxID=3121371 RepID=A0AAJ5W6B1_9SPHI|nr:SusC/RagA family TonB-linked outer membrane protein [Pedobacter sp.]WEK18906.1 MAG: SusC/RagA family TonB-linked outer membrane protein [Pedobacter sp.]